MYTLLKFVFLTYIDEITLLSTFFSEHDNLQTSNLTSMYVNWNTTFQIKPLRHPTIEV